MIRRRLFENLKDAKYMGPGFLNHHLHFLGVSATLKGVGRINVRPGSSDVNVFRQVFTGFQFSLGQYPQGQRVMDLYDQMVAGGRTPLILDLGANNGASALWFRSTYPAAHIVAVEPEPSNARVLRDNTERFGVEVVEAAIGSSSGSVNICDDGEEWGFTTTRSDTGATPIVTIDAILEGHPNTELFIVKVDIEGFESDLFATNLEWLADVSVVLIEPHDWKFPGIGTSAAFQRAFGERDFEILLRDENVVYVRR